MTEPTLSDVPQDLADLADSVASINEVADIVAHLNANHGYTIPPPPFTPSVWAIEGLHREHAAIHAERTAQAHRPRMTQGEADAFFDARSYREGVR